LRCPLGLGSAGSIEQSDAGQGGSLMPLQHRGSINTWRWRASWGLSSGKVRLMQFEDLLERCSQFLALFDLRGESKVARC
jgi:hypothetical protein